MSAPTQLRDDAPPYLDLRPPHWAMNGLSYVLLALAAAASLAAAFVRVSERVSTPFVLVRVDAADPIRSPRDGRLAALHAVEGQRVRAGTAVLAVRSQDASDRFAELATLDARSAGVEASLENARAEHASRRGADGEELGRLERRRASLERATTLARAQLELRKQEAARYAKLHAEGVGAESDWRERELAVNQAGIELEAMSSELAETRTVGAKLRFEMEAREAEAREQLRALGEERDRARLRAEGLRGGLADTSGSEEALLAPCDGTLVKLHVRTPGAIVQEGDLLCDIDCSSGELEAELALPQASLDRVRAGQRVKLLYDAFPFQRYGVKAGELRWVSPASAAPGAEGSAFRARVRLDDVDVAVAGGRRRLEPGMVGRADIVVGRRSLISFAFEPLRELEARIMDEP